MLAAPAALMAVEAMKKRQHDADPERYHARHPGRSRANPHIDCPMCATAARRLRSQLAVEAVLEDDDG